MSDCINPKGSSTYPVVMGLEYIRESRANNTWRNPKPGPGEVSPLTARFMLFSISINLFSFYSFLPPLFSCHASSFLSLTTSLTTNTHSISVSDAEWVKSVAQIWAWRQLVVFCLHIDCCLFDYYSYKYTNFIILSFLSLFDIKIISFCYKSSSLS